MREINLSNSKRVAFIDDSDYELVSKYRWRLLTDKWNNYAIGDIVREGRHVSMHRLILGIKDSKIKIDHKNGNGLDNQRHNLRIATTSQNAANKKKTDNKKTSKYKGVVYRKYDNKWEASIINNYKYQYLGRFKTETEAALAYNKRAIELYGEFAKLNDI